MEGMTLEEALRLMPEKQEHLDPETVQSLERIAHRLVSFGPDRWAGVCMHRLIEHIRSMEGQEPWQANREIERLAQFLMANYQGEIGAGSPQQGESAVDVAIRLLAR